MRRLAALLAIAAAIRPGACEDGPGRRAFEDCRSCHVLEPGEPPGPGPNLHGVVGRPVAGDPAFGYSPALEAAGRGGARWTRAALEAYLRDPEAAIPGTWMTARVREADARRALIDFLADPNSR